MPTVSQIQTLLGVPADGTWSTTDQEVLLKAPVAKKKQIQTLLGVKPDGLWMTLSQGALNKLARPELGTDEGWVKGKASSFADPADVAAFKKCKATGKSDIRCFDVGDNGEGQFGDITAQTHTPFVAVHKTFMISRWGSVAAAAHRWVEVRINGITKTLKVGDRISEPGRIDLNPAAFMLWGLKAPVMVNAEWRWV